MLHKGIYKLVKKDEHNATVLLSDASHPIFQAHFPNHPILPGFVHLEIIAELFSLDIKAVKKAKFTDLVLPEQELHYKKNENKIKVFCEQKEVAFFAI
jgi:3-hydroxyacyl-[acyl-carrier-protein] dehydratase